MVNQFLNIVINRNPTELYMGSVRLKCTSSETKRTNSVNDTNLHIAQMNNEYNEKLLQKQLDYNKEMWNLENEYNHPSAQVERLKAAGLNPALFMQGGNASGSASSHLGITPIPASEAGRQQIGNPDNGSNTVAAFKNLADSLQQTSANMSSSALQSAQAKNINVDTQYKAAQAIQQINESRSRVKGNIAKASLDELQRDLGQATFSEDARAAGLRNDSMQAQTDLYKANATYLGTMTQLNGKQLEYFDRNALADLSLKASQIQSMKVDDKLKRQMIKTEVSKAANLDADTRGKKLNNTIVEKTTDALIRSAEATARIDEGEASDKASWSDVPFVDWYNKGANTLLAPLKGILSGGVSKVVK